MDGGSFAFNNDFNTEPSDITIFREWGGFSFGVFDYVIGYDVLDQDGFVGNGTMLLEFIDGSLPSSIVMDSTGICMTVHSATEGEHHDFTVGPLAHFGQMARITGCACVQDGQVKRIHLSAELETAFNANVFIRSAAYSSIEYDITPSTSNLFLHGDMYLSLIAGFDMELIGSARFTIDRYEDFVEGDLEGKVITPGLGRMAGWSGIWEVEGIPTSPSGRLGLRSSLPLTAGIEGGFYIGIFAPKDRAWILLTPEANSA